MKFIVPSERFISYEPEDNKRGYEALSDEPPLSQSWSEPFPSLLEYHWDGEEGSPMRGDVYFIGAALFVSAEFLVYFDSFLADNGLALPVVLQNEPRRFFRYWVMRECDCINFRRSTFVSSRSWVARLISGTRGILTHAVFDESKWNGTPIFRISKDAGRSICVSEEFCRALRASAFKGFLLSEQPG
jgi:hypothetical protein